MKNTSSLFLTLVSYLITLAAIIFLLFAIMPPSLKAQTNADMVAVNTVATNAAVTNVAAAPAAEDQKNVPSMNIDSQGVHIRGANLGKNQVPFIATLSATLALLIPIVGIVMGCSIPIVIVGLVFYYQHRKNQMLHETVRAMVEKGVPVPPEMFKHAGGDNRVKRPRNDLRTGLLLIGLGVGTAIFMNNKAGFVVLLLGLAFLAASFLEKNNKNNQQPPKA